MKKYIVIFLSTFLSCNAMVQNISGELAYEQTALLNTIKNNPINKQSFKNIKNFYTKIEQQDARSATAFVSLLMRDLPTETNQYYSPELQRKILQWVTMKSKGRTKFAPITEPE